MKIKGAQKTYMKRLKRRTITIDRDFKKTTNDCPK